MKKMLSMLAAILLLALLVPVSPARASGPLDEIKNYTVTVDPRRDGTLDIKYHIDWLVLDSTSEGPLTWVKVGIPNSHVDNIKPLSANIKSIGYTSDGGSWVRIDFDREFKAGQMASFDFSLHQSYMYRLDSANNICSYSFVPGWFDELTVDSLKILWNKANVSYSDSTGTQGSYLTWEATLAPGKRCVSIIRYNSSVFSTDESMQYNEQQNSGSSSGGAGAVVAIVFVALFIFIIIAAVSGGGRSRYRGGFWGGGFWGGGPRGGGGGGGCACASSCACACACAGGGRAGCSAKNFYGAAVDSDKLKEKLIKK